MRRGGRYESSAKGEEAETRFAVLDSAFRLPRSALVRAEPLTGRTHQIRVQSAESGFAVLGDELYGGSAFHRVCLHAESIQFHHPESGEEVSFAAPVDFGEDSRLALRRALIEPGETNSFRLIHGASDGWPGLHVDRLGGYLLSQGEGALSEQQIEQLGHLFKQTGCVGVFHKTLTRQVRKTMPEQAAPVHVMDREAPERFTVIENGVQFELSFSEGYSTGLYLDQRDNRRRLLTGHVAAGFSLPNSGNPQPRSRRGKAAETAGDDPSTNPLPHVGGYGESELLNTFAYTCAFSVCATKAGMRTTSLDLSKKYLDWGRRNFELNGLDPNEHDFIFGDVFDWLKRLTKKGRAFDVILLDPPTFSQSKVSGVFQSGKHYGRLVSAALPLLKPGGVLFASTNNAQLKPEKFLEMIESAVRSEGCEIIRQHYVPQPPDFPISKIEPAYLKTVWIEVS
jgi:23S rRNA (cytosine1962-C5)-methyltransferase